MQKVLLMVLAVWMGVLSGTAAAERPANMAGTMDWHQDSNMAVWLQWDFHAYRDTDFFDFWGLDDQASCRWAPNGVGYEVKLPNYLALEVVVGYTGFEDDASNRLDEDEDDDDEENSVSLDLDTFYIQFSVKRYWPLTDLLYAYGGFGADLMCLDGTVEYRNATTIYREESSDTIYGGHVLAGMEYRIGQRQSPFSVDLRLAYTLLQSVSLDRGLINAINSDADTDFSSRDLNLGGFTLSAGIKYNF